jgi:hypothetical protein
MNIATRPNPSSAPDDQRASLFWLIERTNEEQKLLRDMDDKLFSWSATLFVTAFGALAGINGFTVRVWGPAWRALLVIAIIALVGSLLLLAWQIRTNLVRKQADLERIVTQLNQMQAQPLILTSLNLDGGLYFYIRWGVISLLGGVTLALTWLTFG